MTYGYFFVYQKSGEYLNHILNAYLVYFFIWSVQSMRGQRGNQIGPIKQVNVQKITKKFKDFAGMKEVKNEIEEFVDFLKQPEKYHSIGAKLPRGALLVGPPGTGKTLLAKACAGEANVPFFYMSGSEFVNGYVGMGAKKVKSLFEEAQKSSPSIIFIDELDAIGTKRDSKFGNIEGENTLNQLLVCMDGFEKDSKVIVFAATNFQESLDPALTRAGRFDRNVYISLPNREAWEEILLVHLAKIKVDPSQKQEIVKMISNLTPGFSGADLENVCNEAAIGAAWESSQ